MSENGKVLIVEVVVPEGNEPHYSKLLDLEMLTSPGGLERTEQEYRELLAAAGFRLTRIIPTKSPFSIIEGVRVLAIQGEIVNVGNRELSIPVVAFTLEDEKMMPVYDWRLVATTRPVKPGEVSTFVTRTSEVYLAS